MLIATFGSKLTQPWSIRHVFTYWYLVLAEEIVKDIEESMDVISYDEYPEINATETSHLDHQCPPLSSVCVFERFWVKSQEQQQAYVVLDWQPLALTEADT